MRSSILGRDPFMDLAIALASIAVLVLALPWFVRVFNVLWPAVLRYFEWACQC